MGKPNKVTIGFMVPATMKTWADTGYQMARIANEGWTPVLNKFVADGVDPLNIPDDIKSELTAGMVLRKHELTPVRWGKRDGTAYILSDKAPSKDEAEGWESVNVSWAMGFTSHEVGQMKDCPERKAVIVDLRQKTSRYCSNTFGRLEEAVKRMTDSGKAGGRGVTLPFGERMSETLKKLIAQNKTAMKRGDPSALPEDVLKRKVAAFNATK